MAKKTTKTTAKTPKKTVAKKTAKTPAKKTTKTPVKKATKAPATKPKKAPATKAKKAPVKKTTTAVKKSTKVASKSIQKVKSYLVPKRQNEETLTKLSSLTSAHPSQREYLSNKDFNKAFEADKKEVDDFIAFAKENSWDVEFDKKTRELQISIPDGEKFVSNNTDSKSGNVHLDTDNSSEDSSGTVTQKAFTSKSTETRVGKREATQIENESDGHSALKVAEAYNFPDGDGEGQTIGIIELGGGASKSDIKNYFAHYGVEMPKIQVSGKPRTLTVKDDLEVTADIQVAGLLVPKAKLVIYYGDTILEAMKRALSDSRNKLSVISISWAGSEFGYSQIELEELDQVFYEAAMKGITVVAASGDTGAYNGKQYPNVSVPSIFYHVIGCGGTEMKSYDGVISAETVWNESKPGQQVATGGGFSQKVSLPAFQQRATEQYLEHNPEFNRYDPLKGRGVPDVAANAADISGYSILFEGKWMKIGGTSLATPLWAALVARMNQNLGYNLGFFTPLLYELMGSDAFHPIVAGNNNLYVGDRDWNACTGLGSPNGKVLLSGIDHLKEE